MRMTSIAVFALVLPLAAVAEEPKKVEVKQIDLSDLKFPRPTGKVDRPTIITSIDELNKAVTNAEARDRIKKDADFATQKVLFFGWSGSGGDKLTATVEIGDKGPEVVFHYQRGLTKDLRGHVRVFTVTKAAPWRVEPVKSR